MLYLKQWLYHPTLYYAIHSPANTQNNSHWAAITSLTTKCLKCSTELVESWGEDEWRHGGLWFSTRISFRSGLSILAAVRSDKLVTPDGWEQLVRRAVDNLSRWENEARDVRWMRLTLALLLEDTKSKTSY